MGWLKSFFQSLGSVGAAGEHGACPNCGHGLRTKKTPRTVTRTLDQTRSIQRQIEVTEIYCNKCGQITNDDYYGDVARTYEELNVL